MQIIRSVIIGLACVATLALAGCNMQQGDANVRAVLATACPQWADLEAVYDAIAAEGVLSQSTINYGATAKQAAAILCANRETATVVSVTAAGVRVYRMVDMALADAKRRGVTVGYSGEVQRLERFRAGIKVALDRARP